MSLPYRLGPVTRPAAGGPGAHRIVVDLLQMHSDDLVARVTLWTGDGDASTVEIAPDGRERYVRGIHDRYWLAMALSVLAQSVAPPQEPLEDYDPTAWP